MDNRTLNGAYKDSARCGAGVLQCSATRRLLVPVAAGAGRVARPAPGASRAAAARAFAGCAR